MGLRAQAELFSDLLKKHFSARLVSVVLFGSVGRGNARPDSDIDLLVVIEGLPRGRTLRQAMLDPIYDTFASQGGIAPVNCHLKTPEEAKRITLMYLDLPTDGKILFDRDDFFKKILRKVVMRIKKSGAIRKPWGKFYYWDLKPGASTEETFEIL